MIWQFLVENVIILESISVSVSIHTSTRLVSGDFLLEVYITHLLSHN